MNTTIAAIATSTGGGIGIVRISGDNARAIGEKITQKTLTPRYAHYGNFFDDEQIIDTGIALLFIAPHSFTGEDVVELHCHGGDINTHTILQLALKYGASIANAGEFSLRAFLNGKMDLTQAEATADMINAQSQLANTLAVRSLTGEFATRINTLREEIIHLRMFVEASIDFVDEEIEFIEDNRTQQKLASITQRLQTILDSANRGAILRNGLNIAIIGKPNAGKSSLLNALTGEESAIVTDVAGTTRDSIRESIVVNGVRINIIDTAGMRESSDIVEQEGIRRAQAKAADADIVLLVSSADEVPDLSLLPQHAPKVILVQNKLDCFPAQDISQMPYESVNISAKEKQGLDKLQELLISDLQIDDTQDLFLARTRHIDALKRTLDAIQHATRELQNHNFELLAEELHTAQTYLGEITGEFSSDELLGEIFSSFCIGK